MKKRVRAVFEFEVEDLPPADRSEIAELGGMKEGDIPTLADHSATECAEMFSEFDIEYGGSDFYAKIGDLKVVSADFV